MAGVSIGTLNFVIDGNSAPAVKALDDFERRARRVPTALHGMSPVRAGTERDTKKMLLALNQLSYGVEDFLTVIGTTGFSGGMRAASNNLSQFVRILHPAAGLVAGVGIALGTAMIPALFRTSEASKEAEDSLKSYREELQLFREEAEKQASDERRVRDIQEATKSGQVKGRMDGIREEMRVKEILYKKELADLERIQQKREAITKAVKDFEKAMNPQGPRSGFNIPNTKEPLNKLLEELSLNQQAIAPNIWGFGGEDPIELGKQRIEELRRQEEELVQSMLPEQRERKKLNDQLDLAKEKYQELLQQEKSIEFGKRFMSDRVRDFRKWIDERKKHEKELEKLEKERAREAEKQERMRIQAIQERKRLEEQIQRSRANFARDVQRLEVEGIDDENLRRVAEFTQELKENLRKIDNAEGLLPGEQLDAEVAAREATSRKVQEFIKKSQEDLRNDASGLATGKGADFLDSRTKEGSRRITSAFLRASSQEAEKRSMEEKMVQLLKDLQPAIDKLNRLLDDESQILIPANLP